MRVVPVRVAICVNRAVIVLGFLPTAARLNANAQCRTSAYADSGGKGAPWNWPCPRETVYRDPLP